MPVLHLAFDWHTSRHLSAATALGASANANSNSKADANAKAMANSVANGLRFATSLEN